MAPERQDTWLRRYHDTDAPAELICFPHAGGSAGYWHALSAALPALSVRAVQYPGRQDRYREPAVPDLHRLADLIAEALGDGPPPAGPRIFLGHSMGASLAHEVALRLAGAPDRGPAALLVSGRRAPSRTVAGAERLDTDAALLAKVRSLGGTVPAVLDDPDLLDLVLPALRGDYAALAAYVPSTGAVLACPVVALTGDSDPEAPIADVRAWRDHTTGPFELRVFPGGHFFLGDHLPAVADLAASLSATAPAARR
ncbi:thioesterase II family protein [Streptomyces sp. OR43]|uniref:thioesterase II family protein n=1 Tax=Streptomyces sp. or43 TaxID=2478957 RepID=UPI0011CDF352|nr:alpha/beta fold hydrolase [Streptomyces sp. or43]TXS34638.1 thioesterase [Streptomyces sp. or43]